MRPSAATKVAEKCSLLTDMLPCASHSLLVLETFQTFKKYLGMPRGFIYVSNTFYYLP